jgi:hypothetical protein
LNAFSENFRKAEFGLLGVVVLTIKQTPLLKGEATSTYSLLRELKIVFNADVRVLPFGFFLPLFTN